MVARLGLREQDHAQDQDPGVAHDHVADHPIVVADPDVQDRVTEKDDLSRGIMIEKNENGPSLRIANDPSREIANGQSLKRAGKDRVHETGKNPVQGLKKESDLVHGIGADPGAEIGEGGDPDPGPEIVNGGIPNLQAEQASRQVVEGARGARKKNANIVSLKKRQRQKNHRNRLNLHLRIRSTLKLKTWISLILHRMTSIVKNKLSLFTKERTFFF